MYIYVKFTSAAKCSCWCVINDFFTGSKNNVSFLWYLDFCVFVKSTDFMWCSHRHCAYFFWNLSTIKIKISQILVCCVTRISNMFWAQCWRLETSSKPFLLKWQYSEIGPFFNSWYLPFLNVLYSIFQRN